MNIQGFCIRSQSCKNFEKEWLISNNDLTKSFQVQYYSQLSTHKLPIVDENLNPVTLYPCKTKNCRILVENINYSTPIEIVKIALALKDENILFAKTFP